MVGRMQAAGWRGPRKQPSVGQVGGLALASAWVLLASLLLTSAAGSAGASEPAPSAAQPAQEQIREQAGREQGPAAGGSGLPVPRFVSLKSDRVNMRNGPGTEYPTAWVYKRAGLPVEVIREFEGWRQVRDSDGATGWILQSFLSGRRTGLIMPWDVKADAPVPQLELRASDSASARPVVKIEAGVIAHVHSCDGKWCQVTVETYRGYIEQKKLWGVYEAEVVK